MKKLVLVIMAAGMGSRFGGNKQITPVDDIGHAIMDYSIFDAMRAGFEKVVCIIKHSFEEECVYMTVHSVLHLLGYDHMEEEERKRHFSRQDEIYRQIEKEEEK